MREPEEMSSAQRREYFRARIRLSLLIPTQSAEPRPREGVPYLPPIGSGIDYRILRVRDLSAGGCCCETTDDWPIVGSHLTGYLYLDDARGPLELDLVVLRRQASELESRRPESDRISGSDPDDSSECSGEETEAGLEAVTLVAFRFLEMRESKRQRIMRALFREFRRERRQSDPS